MSEAVAQSRWDAEQFALGAMLREEWATEIAVGLLDSPAFQSTAHRYIFEGIKSHYLKGDHEQWDEVVIHRIIAERTEEVPLSYIHQIQMACPLPANIASYCELVLEDASNRHMGDLLAGATELHANGTSITHITTYLNDELATFTEKDANKKILDISTVGQQALDYTQNPVEPVQWGLAPLDAMLGGIFGGELTIVGARPSVGKTALALQVAFDAATKGHKVAFLALEMSPLSLYLRLASMRRGIPMEQFRRGTEWAQTAIVNIKEEMDGLPLLFVDKQAFTLSELKAEIRRLTLEHEVKLIILDYIGLLQFDGKVSRSLELGYATQMLKQATLEFNIPIIAMSQLNRQSEQRESGTPRLSDLRDSGALEQDADVVLLLHRRVLQESDETLREAKILIAKNRQGQTGVLNIFWNPLMVKFGARTERSEEDAN